MRHCALLGLLVAITAGCSDEPPPAVSTAAGTGGDGGSATEPGAQLPCPPGELELSDGACKPPGVPVDGCAPGFVHDGDGGCVPTLPDTDCATGEMAIIGETNCRPVAPCASGKWGGIPVDPTTVYVDGSYVGGNSDGGQSAPFVTISEALLSAPSGGIVAVAAGTYNESLTLGDRVSLWGTCPADVRIVSPSGEAIHITNAAGDSEIHRVAVSGPYDGILLGGVRALLEQVHVHDTGRYGIVAQRFGSDISELTLRSSLVERAKRVGVIIQESTLEMDECVVRRTQTGTAGDFGVGLSIEPMMMAGSDAAVRRSVIRANIDMGVAVFGSNLTLDACVVEDTLGRPAGGMGIGVAAYRDQITTARSTFTVVDSVVRNNRLAGMSARDSDMTLQRTVVRDTLPELGLDSWGHGLIAFGGKAMPDAQPKMTVSESLIDGAYEMGVSVSGSIIDMESSIVRNVQGERRTGNFGRGISIEVGLESRERSSGNLRGVRVDNVRDMGIFVVGASADLDSVHVTDVRSREDDGVFGGGVAFATEAITQEPASGSANRVVIERCQAGGMLVAGADVVANDLVVRDITPQTYGDLFGDGVVVWRFITPTSLVLHRGTIANSSRAGLANFGSGVSLGDTLFDCNNLDINGEHFSDSPFELYDLGNNHCPCGSGPCKVLSTGIAPPSGIAP